MSRSTVIPTALSRREAAVADVYIYADETGNLDLTGSDGASRYFGFGTAVFEGDHAAALWQGQQLRCDVESDGTNLPNGFHAVDDTISTKNRVFRLISQQAPRFDTTFLLKSDAGGHLRAAGEMRLYRQAWFLHFKELADQVSEAGDTLYVIVATLGTNRRLQLARDAVREVCDQWSADRNVVLCSWSAASSWGLQIADYGLWATQRGLEGRRCSWFVPCIEPTLKSTLTPWGRA